MMVDRKSEEFYWCPHSWISLWTMLQNYCSEFIRVYSGLIQAIEETDFGILKGMNPTQTAIRSRVLRRILTAIGELLPTLEMPVSQELCRTALSTLDTFWQESDPIQRGCVEVVCKSLSSLHDGIVAELQSRLFYFVPGHLVEYYNSIPFEAETIAKFVNARKDMEESGRCFALGRYTACAFHLMRVTEHGLGEIATQYSLSEVKTWGKFLTNLRDFALANKDREKQIMVLHAKIGAIKAAWRDDTMHVTRTYDGEEASEVFQAVHNFMKEITAPLP